MDAPLFITADQTLLDELSRLAAAAGVTPEIVPDAPSALASWASAPLVLVGADLAEGLARLRPPRRDGVHLMSWGRAADDLFRVALACHAENVVGMPESAEWVVEHLTDVGEQRPVGGRTVALLGGSGGVGSTTLTAAIAQTAARTGATVAIDLDPLGPGLDRVLGLETAEGVRWTELCQTTGRISARSLREGLPRRGDLGVLGWYAGSAATPPAYAVREVLTAAQRGHDTVVVDLPRSSGPLRDEVLARADRTLVLVQPTVTGLASAARVVAGLPDHRRSALVVRGVDLAEDEVAQAVGLPVVLTLPDHRGVQESIDLGLGPVRSRRSPLGRGAEELLTARLPTPAATRRSTRRAVA